MEEDAVEEENKVEEIKEEVKKEDKSTLTIAIKTKDKASSTPFIEMVAKTA